MSENTKLMGLTTDIVSAYVSTNSVKQTDLQLLIQRVYEALGSADVPEPVLAKPERQKPAVPIRRSVTPDVIYSLEDGRPFKTLKRHLLTGYGLTPQEYRTKWRLPPDYPMVAPNYAAARSVMAKSMGFGQAKKKPAKRSMKSAKTTEAE